jgi:DNA polymerase V
MKLTLLTPSEATLLPLPLFSAKVQAGFPSPADDHIEKNLDLNQLLIQQPAATFFVRVQGKSMEEAKIYDGDLLVVDRSEKVSDGKIIIAILNGEFTVKRISIKGKKVSLIPEHPDFAPIVVTPESDFQVWGVVTYVIHKT